MKTNVNASQPHAFAMEIQDKSKEELIIELQELRQENNILKILGLQCFWNNCKSLMKYQNVERKREKPIFNR